MSSKQTRSALAPNTTTSPWKVQMGTREIASYAPRVLDGSAGVAPWILAISFRSVQLKSDQSVSQTCIECEQRFELPYLSNKKKFALYSHSKSNKVICVLIKEHFDITDERILTQNWSRASPCKVMFRDTFWWFLLDNCQNLAVCITRCARALDGARTHKGAHIVFEFSKAQTQSLYEECVTLHNNPFHFF